MNSRLSYGKVFMTFFVECCSAAIKIEMRKMIDGNKCNQQLDAIIKALHFSFLFHSKNQMIGENKDKGV